MWPPPTPAGQNFQYTVNITGRFNDASDFEEIVVKVENSSFRCYRDKLQKGRDFLLYSDVKRFKLAGNRGFSFELQSGRPV